jgi:hypothetical protein
LKRPTVVFVMPGTPFGVCPAYIFIFRKLA